MLYISIFFRYLTEDETVTIKQSLTSIYKEIYTFLKRKEYTIDLRKELEKSNPEYHNVLEKLMKDIEKADHGIVIAGNGSHSLKQKRKKKRKNTKITVNNCYGFKSLRPLHSVFRIAVVERKCRVKLSDIQIIM